MGIIRLTDTMEEKALAMLLNSYLKEMAEGFSMQVDLKRDQHSIKLNALSR